MAIRLYADQRIDTLYPDKDQPVSSESALVHIDDMPQNGHVAGYQWYTQGDEIGKDLTAPFDDHRHRRPSCLAVPICPSLQIGYGSIDARQITYKVKTSAANRGSRSFIATQVPIISRPKSTNGSNRRSRPPLEARLLPGSPKHEAAVRSRQAPVHRPDSRCREDISQRLQNCSF